MVAVKSTSRFIHQNCKKDGENITRYGLIIFQDSYVNKLETKAFLLPFYPRNPWYQVSYPVFSDSSMLSSEHVTQARLMTQQELISEKHNIEKDISMFAQSHNKKAMVDIVQSHIQ